MKILITITLAILIAGCSSWRKDVEKISAEPVIVDVYDCSDKAAKFQQLHGGDIVIVRLATYELHAINYFRGYLIDCSYNVIYKCSKSELKETAANWAEVL